MDVVCRLNLLLRRRRRALYYMPGQIRCCAFGTGAVSVRAFETRRVTGWGRQALFALYGNTRQERLRLHPLG